MLKDMLTVTTAQVAREVLTADGYGSATTTTTLTTLTRSQIWQAGGGNRFLSDKIAKASTHVLAIETGEYTFTDADRYLVYDSKTYKLVGHADDISQQGKLTIIGLERIS